MGLHRFWDLETPAQRAISTALLPLSYLYAAGWLAYEGVYRLGIKKRRTARLPVIGIGNLESGGSGKTPLAIAMARLLVEMGKVPVISVSGYGSPASASAQAAPEGALSPTKWGDEAALVRRKLPGVGLIVGRDRVRAAELAAHLGVDVLLLDDGFQHLPLARTADAVTWDASLANTRCLPAGPLREPVSCLRRANAVFMESYSTERLPPPARGKPTFAFRRVYPCVVGVANDACLPLEWLKDRRVRALCAIAKPSRFFAVLKTAGANVTAEIALPDHHPLNMRLDDNGILVVTEKDAVKLAARSDLPKETYALRMDIEFINQEAVADWLTKSLAA